MGLQDVLRQLVVDLSPSKIGVYNTVPVRNLWIGASIDTFPTHERELIASIRRHVTHGESVVLVGGGSGASTVVASRQVGSNGSVVAYEASHRHYQFLKETIELNEVSSIADCHHTIVGTLIHALGDPNDPDHIQPDNLPNMDVLIMDCEGAETHILESLSVYPDTIIVETHAHFDSSTEDVRQTIPAEFEEVSCLQRGEKIDILTFER